MHSPFELPSLRAVTAQPREVAVDLVIVPCPAPPSDAVLARLSDAARQEVTAAVSRGEPIAELGRTTATAAADAAWQCGRVLVVGLGSASPSVDQVRRAVAAGTLWARERRHRTIAIDLAGLSGDVAACSAAAAEAVVLANFNHGHLKAAEPLPGIREASVLVADGQQALLEHGLVIGEAINAARLLANEPGNVLTPRALVERAADLTAEPGVQAEILGPEKIEALGMGLLMGVARGSSQPARLLCLTYTPPGGGSGPVLGLVGKGITFDTGGISIKPADGMDRMKDDMAGGAAVVAAVRAIARLGVPRRVVAVVPATENMPGGNALKPGDVIRGAAGVTVEINNTDAEGRLILGDGLWYAKQRGATHLVDVATLTGACVVALGKVTTGLFGTPPAWTGAVRQAAAKAGEPIWELPLGPEYRELLKSDIADIVNSGGRAGGAITAAMFLREFVGDTPWAHLDIAGTAWIDDAKPWATKGASGVMVRTLVELAAGELP
ncbi:MAG: leucyl aminopeptidase [Vicinamibacterales bacterium]